MIYDRDTWWQEKEQKGRSLIDDIKVLAERARAAGFETAEYVLNLAVAEISKDLEKQAKDPSSAGQ